MKNVCTGLACLLTMAVIATGQTSHQVEGGKFEFHGPFVQENLALFVISGVESATETAGYVSLSQAMMNKWVVVNETGHVNELSIQNVSVDRTVFVSSGSVVKGGKQDRVLSMDLVLTPKCGKIPISSFCVEKSRWARRGGEQVASFGANSAQVSGKSLRKAVKGGRGQKEVWQEVANVQSKLSRNIKENVQTNASPTSFQLAVENKKLQSQVRRQKELLMDSIKGFPKAIGYAITINGEFSTADVYASRALFGKMIDQHVESAIREAISVKDEFQKDKPIELDWRDQLFQSAKFKKKLANTSAVASLYEGEQGESLFRFSCRLKGREQVVVRQSFERREQGEKLEQPVQPTVQAEMNGPAQTFNSRRNQRQSSRQSD